MDLATVIQLSVAPVFLLAGIAGFLNVMSIRLGRIIDRSRVIDRRILRLVDAEQQALSHEERLLLMRRADISHMAIALCTGSAMIACLLIILLFISGTFDVSMVIFIEILFVLTMSLLIVALGFFLREVQLATHNLNIAREFSVDE
jgi:fatty acid desaturase